jgi:uncharacterized protein DUF1018
MQDLFLGANTAQETKSSMFSQGLPPMTDRILQKKIHVACRELGLDADARHDLQLAACGKASMRDMSDADLKLVFERLKVSGWKPTQAKSHNYRERAPRADLRFVHVLWRLLGEAGALKQPDRVGLNAFVRSQFEHKWDSVPIDIDAMRDHIQINAVVNALKAWCQREGITLEQ